MYLNCHTYYSLRYGTLPVEKLAELGKRCGTPALALTDINATTGVYDFIRACEARHIKPIIGLEFRNGSELLYIGLARNRKGFQEMNELLTLANRQKTPLPNRAPGFNHALVVYPFEKIPEKLRGHEYVGVRIRHLNRLIRTEYQKIQDRMVIHHPVTFQGKKEYELHQLLRAIDNNTLLTKLRPGGVCDPTEQMIPVDQLLQRFERFPWLVLNTEQLMAQCAFDFDFDTVKNKRCYTNSRYSDRLLLERLAYEGMEYRYGGNNKVARERIDKELEIINQLGFAAYFLIAWDVVRYSMSRGFFHVGRGSGANSIVSYCLRITDICPIELNLYFERFLNPHRLTPPDFDIDWSWRDRDEVLAYIFRRFDAAHTAFCGTVGTFKFRSIIRELGKVYGLSKPELDHLANSPKAAHDREDSIVHRIHQYGSMLEHFPNMRSMHACGVLITEEPVTAFTALDLPPKGFRTAQIDMYIAEMIGMEKLDILSQRGIGHINDAVTLIERNRGEHPDIHNINRFKRDALCNQMLSEGRTLGCFYIESPAMRGLLRRLKCDNYETLVAASSVIRPGVAKSGMLREYVYRHNNPNDFEYLHPVFEKALGETYGIMVYQEDVIKIAQHFAGLDPSDGDILRRAMTGKVRSKNELEGVRKRFFNNCKEKGYPDELTAEVYRQIESFAGYSFCKSHSASYAVESYQSLFLKAHYPLEFIVAVINNFGGFYRTEIYFHEARMCGGVVHQPCVNRSEYLTTLYGKDIYPGFTLVKGLDSKTSQLIPIERKRNGAYQSFDDFIRRVPVSVENLELLIYSGALRCTGKTKQQLILQSRMLLSSYTPEKRGLTLFYEPPVEYELPVIERSPTEDAFDEIEILGFPVSTTPWKLLQVEYTGDVYADELAKYEGNTILMVGYLVAIKNVPTVKGLMNFGTWIDFKGNFFDSTHFPDQLKRFPFKGAGCYILTAKVAVEFHYPALEVLSMEKIPMVADPRYSDDEEERVLNLPEGEDNHPWMTTRKPYPSSQEVRQKFRRR